MRSPIPNWMAGSRERPQQHSMCRSAEYGVQGDRYLHTRLVGGRGGSIGSPPPTSASFGHPQHLQLRLEKVRLQEEP